MDESIEPMNRRTVLQRGVILLASAVGLNLVEATGRASGPVTAEGGSKILRLVAPRWQTHQHGHQPGELPPWTGRMNRQGDLMEASTRRKAGGFFATCFCPSSSFGGRPSATSIELHSFNLAEGCVFGMGSPNPVDGGVQCYAIVGGTGLYAGARGSYLVTKTAACMGREEVEIVVTINS